MPLDMKRFTDEELLEEVKRRMGGRNKLQEASTLGDVIPNSKKELNPAYELAKSLQGLKEDPRSGQSNPEIDRMFDYMGYEDLNDDTPWCSLLVSYVLKKTGYSYEKLWARDYLNYGVPIDAPEEGCLAIYSRGGNFGHVGFLVSSTEDQDLILGGNQNNEVNMSYYPKDGMRNGVEYKLLGYRRIA